MNYWLMKTEPDVYSMDDLLAEKKQTCVWEGIRNYQARNFMRDDMKIGDKVFIYHSNAKPPGVIGIAEVVKEAYPDPFQFDEKSNYFDPKSSKDNPRWMAVDVKAIRKMERLISLAELKEIEALSEMRLLQRGNRLSVMPVTKKEFNLISKLA